LTPLTQIITEDEAGTIDKYEGDAIIAFWNAPIDQPDHANRAVRAALNCQRRQSELATAFNEISGDPVSIRTRIGLNTGKVSVGNFGSEKRFDYTALGDHMNLAARMESANKQFGTYTMISENTLRKLDPDSAPREMGFVGVVGEVAVRELGRLVFKGKLEPVTVFEAMTPEELAARRGVMDAYSSALRLYYNARFAEALEAFRAIKADDPAAAKYAEACVPLAANPPTSWDGRMTLEAK
ncbi:MAG: adenylate/guanylate cyclase domain-containing protein, partial [Spirochaetales bacterium]